MIVGLLVVCDLAQGICQANFKTYEDAASCYVETREIEDTWMNPNLDIETLCVIVGGEEV